jgi:hypothetical protein
MSRAKWKDWVRIRRLIPIATVLGALTVGILSLLHLFQPTVAEGIIITLLGLLALDSLVERVGLLEKIEERTSLLPSSDQLKDRSKLIDIREMGISATEIAAAGPTLVQLVTPNFDFFAQKMREGCNLKFMLLDPKSPAWEVWHQGQIAPTRGDINSSLNILCELMRMKDVKGKCEVKLSQTYLPFSVVMTNPEKESGQMNVEILALKVSLHNRPHVYLTKRAHERWFNFFHDQFEQHWSTTTNRSITPDEEDIIALCQYPKSA